MPDLATHKEKTLKDITFTLNGKKSWGFVTEKIIDGKRVQFFRGDNPKDEIIVCREKGKDKVSKIRIKEQKWRSSVQ